MPVTRSTKGKGALQSEESKQVPDGLMSMDHVSVFSSGSKLDAKSKSSKSSRKAKAALQLAQLRQRQIELDNEIRLAAVKNEVEMAKLQLTLAEDSEEEEVEETPQPEGKSVELERYLDDCNAQSKREECRIESRTSTVKIDLPKVEMQPFDGDPANYWLFIRQFDACIHSNVGDFSQRLLYLLYYCKGKAKDAIKGCLMLDPEEGYRKARETLKERFGQPHRIARALIDGVLEGLKPVINTTDEFDELATRMQNCEIALTQMGYVSDMNALPTLERIVRRFTKGVQEQWAIRADIILQTNKEVQLADLRAFVVERARVFGSRFGQLVRENEHRPVRTSRQYVSRDSDTSHNFAISRGDSVSPVSCPLCRESHKLDQCVQFIDSTVSERWEALKRRGCCFKCMEDSHLAAGCKKKEFCGIDGCRGRHHRLLHTQNKEDVFTKSGNCAATVDIRGRVQLGMIPVCVKGPLGEIKALAFLDNGSDTTLVKADLLEQLGLQWNDTELTINTVNGTSIQRSKRCKLQVVSIDGTTTLNIDEAYAVNRLPTRTTKLRRIDIARRWPYLKDVPFSDESNGEVKILIGCDVPEAHWVLEQRRGEGRQPFATKTPLGWLLHGPAENNDQHKSYNCVVKENDSWRLDWMKLYNQEFEDVGSSQTGLSIEEMEALKIVNSSAKLVDGRYEIPLPWRSTCKSSSSSKFMATRRLEQLRRKLIRNEGLHIRYREQIEQLCRKGYAEKLENAETQVDTQPCYYIPHHAVINPKKPEKVRIVFDCAAKCDGISLNDCLYSGPDNTSNLCTILMGFRKGPVAVVADIEEMFLRVKLIDEDKGALRFLWWDEKDIWRKPAVYRLNVHPFGATSSPFCANYALRKAVERLDSENKANKYDIASTCFYVDDFITSFENSTTAIEFSQSLADSLRMGGFELKKWRSNNHEVMVSVNGSKSEDKLLSLSTGMTVCQRTLGINWNVDKDLLQFEFRSKEETVSRRSILSCVASLFDPLGLISPLLLPAKVLLQTLCKQGLGWDEPIPEANEREWQLWIKSMSEVNSLTFARCMRGSSDKQMIKNAQLHIFCDASETGYGTVAYGRYHTENGFRCGLLWSKSRVAPTKTVSIPRLELSAAVLGIRACQCVHKSLPDEFDDVYFWTDSTIVLFYIRNVTDRFNTFVANRLAIIHECSRPEQWRYVNTENNPADRASRGCYLKDESMKLWINGPEFLWSSPDEWPTQPHGLQEPEGIERKRAKTYAIMSSENNKCNYMLTYFSEWFKLLKAVAWWLRYKDYLMLMCGTRNNSRLMTGMLKLNEIERARCVVIRLVQMECMQEEFELLHDHISKGCDSYKRLILRSSLRKLCPILRDGMICVGGRLNYSECDVELKHPVILPKSHVVTELIIRYYHVIEGHCGPAQTLASVRKRYWIVQAKLIIKRVVGSCAECKRRNLIVNEQMMAPLPGSRVTPGWRAFNVVGLDYFGPFLVKKGRSMEKRYGCLFTCLQIRAVHIEIAHSLSTDSFLMALMRFIGRRGTPTEIYSDNGTGFVGAETELKLNLDRLSQNRINDKLLKRGIQWHFNPPYASHRGGVWERMIRSVRKILNTLPKEQTVNDEMLETLMVEAERILNSRPIVSANDDHRDNLALTPNDLILLHDNSSHVVSDNLEQRFGECWKRVNYLAHLFWTRWTREYLPTLQLRQKWLCKTRNFKQGDVVLVLSEPKQFGKWPLGIVMKVEEDADGLVRTVIVRVSGRELRRDVRKVSLLEGVD